MSIKEYTNEEKQDEQIENSRYSNNGGFESFLPGTHTIKEPTSHNISIERQTVTVTSNDELQSAINALEKIGGGILALKSGTYIITEELKGISSIQIIGENKSSTIIDFKSTAAKLSFTGTSIYSTGTITSITSGVNVTGSGTSWLSNLTTDHQFFIAQRWYKIAAITSDTTLILAEGYAGGATFPGASYRAAILKKDIEIKELTFKNSTGNALDLDDCRDIFFEDVSIESNNVGLTADYCSEFVGDGVIIVSSTGNGANLTQCGFTNFTSFSTPSNGGHGVVLNNCRVCTFNRSSSSANTTDGYNITSCSDILLEIEVSSNGGQGIELVSGNDNIVMRSCLASSNTSDGIKLTATSDNCKIVYSDIKLNGGYGINIAAATCDNNIITANRFSTNTSGAISDSGTATIILINQGAGQGTSGQVLTSNGTGSAPTFQGLPDGITVGVGKFSRTNAQGTGTQNVAHGLGKVPKLIKIRGYQDQGSNNFILSDGNAVSTSSENAISLESSGATTVVTTSTSIILFNNGANRGEANISALDSTNFTLDWTTAVNTNTELIWEAFA